MPGVSVAGAINTLPVTGGGAIVTTIIEEFPPGEDEFPPTFLIRRTTPGYFEAMGIPIIEGRSFTADDHDLRLGSLIISESIKDQYWPEVSALGKRVTTAGAAARVVGVAGDDRGLPDLSRGGCSGQRDPFREGCGNPTGGGSPE